MNLLRLYGLRKDFLTFCDMQLHVIENWKSLFLCLLNGLTSVLEIYDSAERKYFWVKGCC